MKKIRFVLSLILIILTLGILTGCNTTTEITTTKEEAITLESESYTLLVGDLKYIRYTIVIDTGDSVVFTSSDPSVASVTRSGFVTGVSLGNCTVTLTYGDYTYEISISVTKEASFTAPSKTVYGVNEELDLSGGAITDYTASGQVSEIIALTPDMISGFDTSSVGEKLVTVTYNDYSFTYKINVINISNTEAYQFNTFTVSTMTANETSTIKAIPKDLNALLENVNSVYDYSTFELTLEIVTPSGENDLIYAFYTQDYNEVKSYLSSMNSSLNLEGTVDLKDGYYYSTTFVKSGNPYFAFRYNPEEVGEYTYTFSVLISEEIMVQTFSGSFNVVAGEETKGVVSVSSNNTTFEYADGTTYLPVGANVAWYTSRERRYNDYTLWMEGMSENGLNYARLWFAPWGSCLFWDDIEDYSTRLDEAYEMDLIIEMMSENGVYVDLSIFQHGMFSLETNSMWDSDSSYWYVSRYGYNPYSDVLSSPGEFFTSSYAIKWTENYLKYIVARYGSSDNILSYELFNEVDWIEEYTVTEGTAWHDEMAKYIKSIDYKDHLVTTSTTYNGYAGYTTYAASVFSSLASLSSLDYINLHYYGTGVNFLTYIPSRGTSILQSYNKPVMFQECGYSGSGGADQMNVDPDNTSLHQEIWGGMMSIASGGMPWWWESWLEPGDAWGEYKGATEFLKLMDLSGDGMILAYKNGVSTSNTSRVRKIGYIFSNKAYLYLYDTYFKVNQTDNGSLNTDVTITSMDKGTYTITLYNTYTGAVIQSKDVTTTETGVLIFNVSFENDVAITIIKK